MTLRTGIARELAEQAAREDDGTIAVTGLTGNRFVVLAVSERHNPGRFRALRALHRDWYPGDPFEEEARGGK